MRVMLLVPGTGHFYCGSCLRDDWLAKGLTRRGHDVEVVPLYLPLVREEAPTSERVHMGGINMYLQQKLPVASYLPGFMADWLDSPGLLRWASRRGNMTDAPDLGAMTVSMLEGEHGRQSKELDKLVRWIAGQPRPDVIVLSNAMLTGVADKLAAAIGVPILCSLQGEAPFLDGLSDDWTDKAWAALRRSSRSVRHFIAVSGWYGDLMADRLGLDAERMSVIPNGIDIEGIPDAPPPLAARVPRTIGYLARLCADKGADALVDAFIELKSEEAHSDLRLRLAGVVLKEDRALVNALRARVTAAGFGDCLDVMPNVTRDEKLAFLQTLSVLSVPALYGESFGLYVLEALACGVPVVQPDIAAFSYLIESTGGGALVRPGDVGALAAGLRAMLEDEDGAQRMALAGRAAVLDAFTSDRMARDFEDVCTMCAS